MSKTIVIDPGHGGVDPGATGYGLQEENLNLDIALKIKENLNNYADVSLTRSTDRFISLSERADYANKLGADLFLSIHINAGGGTGFESYIHPNAGSVTQNIQDIIHQECATFYKKNGFPDRGQKEADFAVLRETVGPAVLLENLFIDNIQDVEKLKDPQFRTQIAEAISRGVIKAMDLESVPQQPTQPPHWAMQDFARLKEAGLVFGEHDLDNPVTWGEMSAVLARLLDKLNL